jgi:hypothetical protein
MEKFGPISHGIICTPSGGFAIEVPRYKKLQVAFKVYFGRQIEV